MLEIELRLLASVQVLCVHCGILPDPTRKIRSAKSHGTRRIAENLRHVERPVAEAGGRTRQRHDAQTCIVAFCRYCGVTPRACAPYGAWTKGNDERGVGYVQRNVIAAYRFVPMEELQAHLARWMREVANSRVRRTSRTSAEPPIDRLEPGRTKST